MTKYILFLSSLFGFLQLSGQYTYKIRTDSLLVTNNSHAAEFILLNATRSINGYLYNKSNGRTEFSKAVFKLTDSTYLFGPDTIKIPAKKALRFGLEDTRATQNRIFSDQGVYYFIIDSSLFAVKGKDSAGVVIPAALQSGSSRMIFYPFKSAFRAGLSTTNLWDNASLAYYSAGFGINSRGTGAYSFGAGTAIGQGTYSVAFSGANVTGNYSMGFGNAITVSGAYSIAATSSASATSLATTALGFTAIANDTGAVAIGYNPNSTADYAFAAGYRAYAIARHAVSVGRFSYVSGISGFAFGSIDTVKSTSGTAIGYTNKVINSYQTAIGKYNDTTDTKNLFAVGNGFSVAIRRNVFTIDTSGNTSVGVAFSSGSVLEVNGSYASDIQTVTSNTTLSELHSTILANASGGNITLTLPAANQSAGRIYIVKLISSSNSVTIQRSGSDTIDGGTSISKNTQWGVFRVQSDGSNWYVTASK